MNTFSKYGNDLLGKLGVKTSSSDSLNLPIIKKAKFVKKFDMKVTRLQSYALLRRDSASPTQTVYTGDKPKTTFVREQVKQLVHRYERPIDRNNVVTSIHRNLHSSKHVMSNQVTHIECRDDENQWGANDQSDRVDSSDRRNDVVNRRNEFKLDDDYDSIKSIWTDCCTLTVEDIYDEDELLGLAFVQD